MSNKVLEVKNINKTYKRRGKEHKVLSDINVIFEEGKFYTIEGESGTGKSTLISLLLGLQKADEGSIIYHNDNKITDITNENENNLSKLRTGEISYIPQTFDVVDELDVERNIKLSSYFTKNENDINEDIIKKLGLEDLRNLYPGSLSGGEIRRVVIARSLINKPRLILADEPTNDLDKNNREKLISILKEEAERGAAVVAVTHDESLARAADVRFYLEDSCLSEL